MSSPRRDYGRNQLHFTTASTYRRARLFDSLRFRQNFVSTLGALRNPLQFKILGYVLMPEHFHLLLRPSEKFDPSQILKSLKERTAKFMLRNLLDSREHPWCRKILDRLTLPATVHDEARYRVWQRRFYDLSIWTERKRLEKLKYMHGNPLRTGARQRCLLVTCHLACPEPVEGPLLLLAVVELPVLFPRGCLPACLGPVALNGAQTERFRGSRFAKSQTS